MHFCRITAHSSKDGFSLVEVVVAVGIFAIAVVACIGLLGPINNSVAEVRDGDDATRVIGIVQAELQRAGITDVAGFIGQTIYANRAGNKVALENDAKWDTDVPDLDGDSVVDDFEKDAQKFFEIRVTANPSFTFNNATDGFLAINLEVRWPGFTANGVKVENAAREQQSVLVFPVAITR